MKLVIINFDGACEPNNPGGWITASYVLADAAGTVTHSVIEEPAPANTNNIAEYYALGFALRRLIETRRAKGNVEPFELVVRGDSQLVIKQMNGEWSCNKPHLQKLRRRCLELIEEAKAVGMVKHDLEWVKRELNEEADALGRALYLKTTGKPMPERNRLR